MILVRVRQHDAFERRALLLDEAEVGEHDVDAGLGGGGERDAEIDHQPAAGVGGTEPVEIDVHADLAQAPERDEHELVGLGCPAVRYYLHIGHSR